MRATSAAKLVLQSNSMVQDNREEEAVLPEQASQTSGGFLSKPVHPRLVFSAASENQVLGRRETIIRVTKDHEIVDVDGFVFKRKRRMPLSESANSPDAHAKRVKPCDKYDGGDRMLTVDQVEDDGYRRAGYGCILDEQAANHLDATAVASMAQAALKALPCGEVSEGSRLMALCRKCVEDAVAGAEGTSGERQLQDMLSAFLADVETSLENGTLQAADAAPSGNAAVQEQRLLLAQLAKEQDLLWSRLQCFEQEEQEWLRLMRETEDTAKEASPAAAAHGDTHCSEAASAGRDVAEPASMTSHSAAATSGNENAREPEGGQSAVVTESLRQAQIQAHRTLTLQVDGLCAMVEGVQELVARAEQISSKEFDTLFKKNFSALPGLNSPARLIREIVKPSIVDAGASTGT